MRHDVDVVRPAVQPDESVNSARSTAKSVWEYQCVAHDLLGTETRDHTLKPWRADGWEPVQVVTKGTHEFHYVRRLHQKPDDVAD
jgi:hypothetical protein